jgi:nucleoside-diphosphate-sugar epimerase
MRVLVTGANGFVGRHLVSHLVTQGHTVVAATRTRQSIGVGPKIEHVEVGEVDRATDWSLAIDGVGAVVHLVTPVLEEDGDVSADNAQQVIIDGARSLAEQALEHGVGRFVFLSSIKAMGELSGDVPLEVKSECMPESRYGAAKLEAERALVATFTGAKTTLTVLRPPVVYGPGNRGSIPRLIAMLDQHPGRACLIASANNRRGFIYVGNLVGAITAAVKRRDRQDRCFLPRDPNSVSTGELARIILRNLGHTEPSWSVPGPVARFAVRAFYGPEAVARLFGSLDIDDQDIKVSLGWQPEISLEEGIARTISWMRETGALARRV